MSLFSYDTVAKIIPLVSSPGDNYDDRDHRLEDEAGPYFEYGLGGVGAVLLAIVVFNLTLYNALWIMDYWGWFENPIDGFLGTIF
mmetsp:Transcript_8735/g.13524  ORF Transcript_8735/g.13524 Transcript_8735/m.13524 type:complete len:85 (-) Transcript_8735:819-1073(-)